MPRKIADIRREEIVEALRGVVARDGLNVPSYDAIATEGDMSRQLVRHYYRSPEDMAADLAKRLTVEMRNDVKRTLAAADGEARLDALLETMFAFDGATDAGGGDRNALECALHAIARHSPKVEQAFETHLQAMRELIANELADDDRDRHSKAEAITALVIGRNLPGSNPEGLRRVARVLAQSDLAGG